MNKTYEEQRTAAEKIEDEIVKRRVLKGIDLLKEEYGEDWAKHIDLDELSLSSARFCVLGQVESETRGGDFTSAVSRIDGDLEVDPSEFGFDSGFGIDGDVHVDYSELQDAWELVIGDGR